MKFRLHGAGPGSMAPQDAIRLAEQAEELGLESPGTGEQTALPDPSVPPSHLELHTRWNSQSARYKGPVHEVIRGPAAAGSAQRARL